jgi:ABC-type antimicrobial peptide transport system permease subunit
MALAISSRRLWQKALGAVSTLLILHTTLLTFSRGATVGMLAVGAVAFLLIGAIAAAVPAYRAARVNPIVALRDDA